MRLMAVWSASVSSSPHYLQIQYWLFKHWKKTGLLCLNSPAIYASRQHLVAIPLLLQVSPLCLLNRCQRKPYYYIYIYIQSWCIDIDVWWKITVSLYVRGLSVNAQPVLLLTLTNSGMLLIRAWQIGPTLPPPTTNTSPYVPLSPTSIRFHYVIWYHTPAEHDQEVLVRKRKAFWVWCENPVLRQVA